jgi:hypothetical protein
LKAGFAGPGGHAMDSSGEAPPSPTLDVSLNFEALHSIEPSLEQLG